MSDSSDILDHLLVMLETEWDRKVLLSIITYDFIFIYATVTMKEMM